jgi:hypothetical protein
MPKPRKDPYKPRPCRFCKLEFKPTTKNPKNADEQQFCCAAHRKEFWKHGKLPLQKFQLRMEKRMRIICRQEIREAIESGEMPRLLAAHRAEGQSHLHDATIDANNGDRTKRGRHA